MGLLHLLDTAPPQFSQLFLRDLHGRGQDVHHHIHLYRQLEQQPADVVLTALHGRTECRDEHGGQNGEAILGGHIVTVELQRLLHELVLAPAVGQRHGRLDLPVCGRIDPHQEFYFFIWHSKEASIS